MNTKKKNPNNLKQEDIKLLKKELEDNWKIKWKELHQEFSSDEAIEWLKKDFTYEEVKQWINKGLKSNEYNLASYLRVSNHSLSEELKQKYYQAQNWLEFNYPQEKRSKIKELVITNFNLEGSLKLENFPNLEELYCPNNKLTSLECYGCPKLKNVLCQRNKLLNLTLENCPNIIKIIGNKNQLTSLNFLQSLPSEKLEMLNISSNNISDSNLIPFQNFVNLKHLGLGNWYKEIIDQGIYNYFNGSLEPLKNLINLEELDLAGTDVDSGWEYLPENLQILYLFAKESPESKVKFIVEDLRQYGETTKDKHEDNNFGILLVKYRVQVLQIRKNSFYWSRKRN